MTREQLTARNAELEKVGKRICARHQGAALPLDKEHFPKAGRWYRRICVDCYRDIKTAWKNEYYRTNAAFAEQQRRTRKRIHVQHQRARFAAILAAAQGAAP